MKTLLTLAVAACVALTAHAWTATLSNFEHPSGGDGYVAAYVVCSRLGGSQGQQMKANLALQINYIKEQLSASSAFAWDPNGDVAMQMANNSGEIDRIITGLNTLTYTNDNGSVIPTGTIGIDGAHTGALNDLAIELPNEAFDGSVDQDQHYMLVISYLDDGTWQFGFTEPTRQNGGQYRDLEFIFNNEMFNPPNFVPEPTALALLALGVAGVVLRRRVMA